MYIISMFMSISLTMYIWIYMDRYIHLVLQLHNNKNGIFMSFFNYTITKTANHAHLAHGLWLLCQHPCHAPKERPTPALRQELQAPAVHGPKEGSHIALLISEPLDISATNDFNTMSKYMTYNTYIFIHNIISFCICICIIIYMYTYTCRYKCIIDI